MPALLGVAATTARCSIPRHLLTSQRGGKSKIVAMSALAAVTTVRRRSESVIAMRASFASAAADPEWLFNALFLCLAAACFGFKVATREKGSSSSDGIERSPAQPDASSLRRRFLAVFWLFKMADWLHGAYFYDVYSSKVIGGQPVQTAMISRIFLTGFGTAAILGATTGRMVDTYGRKAGSLVFAVLYSLSALSTCTNSLPLLFAGRVAGGIGTALLFSAPEAWLVDEHQRGGNDDPDFLSKTFGAAYFGDSVVAILAGQVAGVAATKGGPTAPFVVSLLFLALGALVVAATWSENTASSAGDTSEQLPAKEPPNMAGALRLMLADPRILSVGIVQALFEGAMYIFVMQWPPALVSALPGRAVPFGKVFSCLMASCMIGSSTFGPLIRSQPVEKIAAGMLAVACAAMGIAAVLPGSLAALVLGFCLFEACVGLYFPAIGTLRSKYLPDSHRGLMMAMFRVPLNVIVAAVMLGSSRLGLKGSMVCSTTALFVAFLAQLYLYAARK